MMTWPPYEHGRNKHEENEISILHHLLFLTHLTYRLISSMAHSWSLVQLSCLWNRYKMCLNRLSNSFIVLGFQRYEMCHSPLLALWGNKIWLPSMIVKNLVIIQKEMGLKWRKWSSMNATSTENPLSHSVLGLWEFPSHIIGTLG